MKYNFDKQISRRGTDSYKWDSAESENVLPMWVADMDFRTAPAIVDALRRRVEHGISVIPVCPTVTTRLLQAGSHVVTVGRLTVNG